MTMLGDDLQSRVIGNVTDTGDSPYKALRRAIDWNKLKPGRYPRLILARKACSERLDLRVIPLKGAGPARGIELWEGLSSPCGGRGRGHRER
jgi:hypothetical protein